MPYGVCMLYVAQYLHVNESIDGLDRLDRTKEEESLKFSSPAYRYRNQPTIRSS